MTTTTDESPTRLSVPDREPCSKCGRPVFLAERLLIDDKLYHSTCFRCARCLNQLQPGNYYQTEEHEDRYCCETCPDEDEQISLRARRHKSDNAIVLSAHSARNSNSSSDDESEEEELGATSYVDGSLDLVMKNPTIYVSKAQSSDERDDPLEENVSYPKDNNPFGSSDDEDDEDDEDIICDEVNSTQTEKHLQTGEKDVSSENSSEFVVVDVVDVANTEEISKKMKTIDLSSQKSGKPKVSSDLPNLSVKPIRDNPFDSSDDSEIEVLEDKESPLKKIRPRKSQYVFSVGSTGSTSDAPGPYVKKTERISVGPAFHSINRISAPVDATSSDFDSSMDSSLLYQTALQSSDKSKEESKDIKEESYKNPFDSSENEDEEGKTSVTNKGTYYRKKKPAPKPPTQEFSSFHFLERERKSPSSSIASSTLSLSDNTSLQSFDSKYRSPKRRAPLPPLLTSSSSPLNSLPYQKPVFSLSVSTINQTINDEPPMSTLETIETEKVLKDESNRNKQHCGGGRTDKSLHGQWKRKKGKAPSKPVAIKRSIRALPSAEVKKELEKIEVQLHGLEKQGVRLEEMIREQCEGPDVNPDNDTSYVPIEVEDLILQLFEVVNEKNELCRRQAELMYLKRQHRLEEEQAEVEYEIRCLMLKTSKTDTDKVREETLIARLLQIVDLRAEIVECLEMDRVREAEEDTSITNSLNSYANKRDEKYNNAQNEPQKKKEEKESKKRFRKKMLSKLSHIHSPTRKLVSKTPTDADKDVDESVSSNCPKEKDNKKKKMFKLF